MFLSFLRIAIRTAIRQKTYSLINVLGLTVGILATVMISLWILDEISYDSYFENSDRIHRIDLYSSKPQTRTPYPMAQAMIRDFPEVEMATSMSPLFGPNMSRPTFSVEFEDFRFDEKSVFGADTNFFNVFSFEFIMGNPLTAFQVPHAIIITREISEKYFGKANPIGKMLTVNKKYEFMITGVLENLPSNIHFHFDFLISYAFLKQISASDWFSWADPGHYNYVLTAEGADSRLLQKKITEWIIQYIDFGEEFNEDLLSGNTWFQLTPIRDIHLNSNIRWELESNSKMAYVYIFLVTALMILVVACINYMNLATARFSRRAKEVAVRKTAGANRRSLINQFLLESMLQTIIAAILAVFLIEILLPYFSLFTAKDYSFYYSQTGLMILALIVLAGIIGLIAGSYPAFYLSSLNPMHILKGKITSGASALTIRIVLVVFQFTISIFLIIGTITIFKQLKFMENKNPGFNMEDVVVIPIKDDQTRSQIKEIKEMILQYPDVVSVSAVSNIPGGRINNNALGFEESTETVQTSEISVDYDFIETLNLNIIKGRNFYREFGLDSISRFIINETAAKELAIENPINQIVVWYDDDSLYRGEIIGIVKDFHYKSLHNNIAPLIIMIKPAEYSYVLVRLSSGSLTRILGNIKNEWKKFDDLFTFEYSMLEDVYNDQYSNENKMGIIYWILAILAVIIASLGLYGLSTFTVEQKTQEIGMRKVHGATSTGILRKLIFDFSRWVLVAFLIAIPFSYWGMSYWLRGFSYQIELSFWIFLPAFLITEFIAIIAVSSQSIKAANLKPVDSLRYE